MVRGKKTYKTRNEDSRCWRNLSAVFMMFNLLLLTISAPLTQVINEKLEKKDRTMVTQTIEENLNPYGGMTEEKHGGGSTSDYLHDCFLLTEVDNPRLHHATPFEYLIYLKYYGELVSPPPEARLA